MLASNSKPSITKPPKWHKTIFNENTQSGAVVNSFQVYFPFPEIYFIQLQREKFQCPNKNFLKALPMSSGINNNLTGYHNRRSIRLRGYDYSQPGFYFVTICNGDRNNHCFCGIRDGRVIDTDITPIIRQCWNDLPEHYPNVSLDEFVIMPNHIHGIIGIGNSSLMTNENNVVALDAGAGFKPAPAKPARATMSAHKPAANSSGPNTDNREMPRRHGLPEIVRAFKTFSSRRINETGQQFKWQRNYFEHIIRGIKSLSLIRQYIRNNPVAWDSDKENHLSAEISSIRLNR